MKIKFESRLKVASKEIENGEIHPDIKKLMNQINVSRNFDHKKELKKIMSKKKR